MFVVFVFVVFLYDSFYLTALLSMSDNIINSVFDPSAGEDQEQEEMIIMPLGGGQEVGRSCILLKYRGRTVMLDCGNHPGREGNAS